jgi:hypothetical protein
MERKITAVFFGFLLVVAVAAGFTTDPPKEKIPAGAKVFVAPMPDGFDTYLKDALAEKKVPVQVVAAREDAEYEITGQSETQKAGKAKKAILLDWHSNEQASIQVANIKSGAVVFAYSVNKQSSVHGKRSTAEACAKHIKESVATK